MIEPFCPHCHGTIRHELYQVYWEAAAATATNKGVIGMNPYGEDWPGGGLAFGNPAETEVVRKWTANAEDLPAYLAAGTDPAAFWRVEHRLNTPNIQLTLYDAHGHVLLPGLHWALTLDAIALRRDPAVAKVVIIAT